MAKLRTTTITRNSNTTTGNIFFESLSGQFSTSSRASTAISFDASSLLTRSALMGNNSSVYGVNLTIMAGIGGMGGDLALYGGKGDSLYSGISGTLSGGNIIISAGDTVSARVGTASNVGPIIPGDIFIVPGANYIEYALDQYIIDETRIGTINIGLKDGFLSRVFINSPKLTGTLYAANSGANNYIGGISVIQTIHTINTLTASNISASGFISSSIIWVSQLTASSFSTNGNITTNGSISASTLQATNLTVATSSLGTASATSISSSGFISGSNIWCNNLNATLSITSSNISASNNISGNNIWCGNLNATSSITSSNISASGFISGNNIWCNNIRINSSITSSNISASGFISGNSAWINSLTSSNSSLGTATATSLSASGNISGSTGIFSIISGTNTISGSNGIFHTLTINNSLSAADITETSSIRYKTNVINLENDTLKKVLKLRPVRYEKILNNKKEIGLIAEEVDEIYPEFVLKDSNGNIEGLNYGKMVSILIKAIQELSDEVDKLKLKINILENNLYNK